MISNNFIHFVAFKQCVLQSARMSSFGNVLNVLPLLLVLPGSEFLSLFPNFHPVLNLIIICVSGDNF